MSYIYHRNQPKHLVKYIIHTDPMGYADGSQEMILMCVELVCSLQPKVASIFFYPVNANHLIIGFYNSK